MDREAERYLALVLQLMDELDRQEDVAAKLGVDQTYISKISKGTRAAGRGVINRAVERMNLRREFFYADYDGTPNYRDFLIKPGERESHVEPVEEMRFVPDRTPEQRKARSLLEQYRASPRGTALDAATWELLVEVCNRKGEPDSLEEIDKLASTLLYFGSRPAAKPASERDLKGYMPAPAAPPKKRR